MPSGIASIPRYQQGGPTRRNFIKMIMGGLGGLATRIGFPWGDESGIDIGEVLEHGGSSVGPRMSSEEAELLTEYWLEDVLMESGINPGDVPEGVYDDLLKGVIRAPDVQFKYPLGEERRRIIAHYDAQQRSRLESHGWTSRQPRTEPWNRRTVGTTRRTMAINKELGDLLASGDARFRGGLDPQWQKEFRELLDRPRTGLPRGLPNPRYLDADPNEIALYQELQELTRSSDARREAERQTRRQARSALGREVFGPEFSGRGILDSPVWKEGLLGTGGWDTARKWAGRGLGALGLGVMTAADLAAAPTKLGQSTIGGDEYSSTWPHTPIPEKDVLTGRGFTDEEMEIIRANQREEFQTLEDLGLTTPLSTRPRVSPQGSSIRPRGFGRASGGIIGLGRAA